MTIKEVRANLNRKVWYCNKAANLEGEFILNACIIRKGENGIYCQAEIQQSGNSVMITSLEDIHTIAAGKEQK